MQMMRSGNSELDLVLIPVPGTLFAWTLDPTKVNKQGNCLLYCSSCVFFLFIKLVYLHCTWYRFFSSSLLLIANPQTSISCYRLAHLVHLVHCRGSRTSLPNTRSVRDRLQRWCPPVHSRKVGSDCPGHDRRCHVRPGYQVSPHCSGCRLICHPGWEELDHIHEMGVAKANQEEKCHFVS